MAFPHAWMRPEANGKRSLVLVFLAVMLSGGLYTPTSRMLQDSNAWCAISGKAGNCSLDSRGATIVGAL